MRSTTAVLLGALELLAPGCGKTPPPEQSPPATSSSPPLGTPKPSPFSLADRDWRLTTLGDHPAPTGAGGRPATLRFDGASSRAAGFAGCNQFSARYTTAGDSLDFGPVISTKMACADGDKLERSFWATLDGVTRYQVADSTLTLSGPGGPLARFRVAPATDPADSSAKP